MREAMSPELQGVRAAAEPLRGELTRQRESIDAIDVHLEEVGDLLSTRISELHDALAPLEREVSDVREVVEPLQSATERVGRAAERLPGPGRKKQ